MSFKQFGGLNYAAKNNIIGSLYSSSTNSGTANIIGLENSKITSQSHLDMSANSVMHIGSLYFMDGTIQSTAYANSSGTAPTFNDGIIVNNGSHLNGEVFVTGGETVTGGLTTDTLHVTGISGLDDLVTASNGLTISSGDLKISSGELTVSSGSTTLQDLTVNGNASIHNLTVTETLTLKNLIIKENLTVGGTSTLVTLNTSGLITANAGLTIPSGQTLTVNGTSALQTTTTSTLHASGLITGDNGLTITAGTSALLNTTTTTLHASGLITGDNGLTITSGTSALKETTTTTLQASGLITAGAGLTSTAGLTTLGTTTATSLNIAGATLGSNVLAVNGTTSLQGATAITYGGLNVTGGVTVANTGLTINSGGETISAGDLTVVTGSIKANGGYILSTYAGSSSAPFNLLTGSTPSNISFGPSLGTITIASETTSSSSSTGALVVDGGVGIKGNFYNGYPITVGSPVTAYFDNLRVGGTLSFDTTATFAVGNLTVEGYANISSDLNVGGNAVITGNLTVDGSLNYKYTYTNLALSGTLTVDGESYLNGGINVVHNSITQFSVDGTTGNTVIGPTAGTTATLDVYGNLTINSQDLNFKQNSSGDTQTVQWLDNSGSALGLIYSSTLSNALIIDLQSSLTNGFRVSNAETPVFTVSLDGDATAKTLALGGATTGATLDVSGNITSSGLLTSNGGIFAFNGSKSLFDLALIGTGSQATGELSVRCGANFTPCLTSDTFTINYSPTKITCNYQEVSITCPLLSIQAPGSSVINISGGTCTAGTFNSSSDYRIKECVTELNDEFNVDKLRPVTYTNKNTQKQDIGFIAHEVQEEFPYLVSGEKDGEEMQSLNYIGLIGVLVKEIQDLKKRVHILENK
jgi:hypothetical protein